MLALHRRAMLAAGRAPEPLGRADLDRLQSVLRAVRRSRQPARRVAAELAAGVAAAQAFHDGNKRTAVLAAATYLDMKGEPVPRDWRGFAQLLEPIAAGARGPEIVARLEGWLRDQD